MKLTRLFVDFFNSEKSGGIVLIFCTVFSLLITNSAFSESYQHLWHINIAGNSAAHWINDGLMAIFFLLIGLELEREVYIGELSNLRNASLPIFSALGGMIVPAAIFILFNYSSGYMSGAGIPMATDIAFAIGILSLLGNRVPPSLKILLIALAVIDDLGAIMVIAIFYTKTISLFHLGISLGLFAVMLVLNRLKVHNLLPYLALAVGMWYFMLHSGVHATISGVLAAFAIPFSHGREDSPSYILQQALHTPVALVILPLFALANTSIQLDSSWYEGLAMSNSIGIMAGLLFGKPLGILLFGFLAVKSGICSLPANIGWRQVTGIGFLGGIGFTMSIFITMLAFSDPFIVTESKIAILLASLISGIVGYLWLNSVLDKKYVEPEVEEVGPAGFGEENI